MSPAISRPEIGPGHEQPALRVTRAFARRGYEKWHGLLSEARLKKPILRPACFDRAGILIFTRQIIFVIGRFVCILNLRDCVSLFPYAVLRLRQAGDIYREHGVNYPTAIFDSSVKLRYRPQVPIVCDGNEQKSANNGHGLPWSGLLRAREIQTKECVARWQDPLWNPEPRSIEDVRPLISW